MTANRFIDLAPSRQPLPKEPRRETGSLSPLLIPAAEVRASNASFAWEPYLPMGTVTVLAGIGGLGKSHLGVHVASRVTRGQLEGDLRGTPADSVIATAEDALAQTMVPRLKAAGADLNRVAFVNVEGGFAIPDDLTRLEEACVGREVKIVLIDPIMAFIPPRLDSHKDQHARAALAPLASLAERLGASVLCVMHLNKAADAGALFLRVSGSVGFLNAARSALLVAEDPNDSKARVLAHGKANLSEPGESKRFLVEGVELDDRDQRTGKSIKSSRLAWLGSSPHSVQELLKSDRRRAPRDAAEEWLSRRLAGGPVLADELEQQAELAGHAWTTVRRAKKELGITAIHPTIPGPWYWALPGHRREVVALQPQKGIRPAQLKMATSSLHGSQVATAGTTGPAELGWHRLQREAGEEPETDDEVAFARLTGVLAALEEEMERSSELESGSIG